MKEIRPERNHGSGGARGGAKDGLRGQAPIDVISRGSRLVEKSQVVSFGKQIQRR